MLEKKKSHIKLTHTHVDSQNANDFVFPHSCKKKSLEKSELSEGRKVFFFGKKYHGCY